VEDIPGADKECQAPYSRRVLGRGRFDDVVRRQLDLFEEDEAALLEEADEAEDVWTHSPREESEERYGDYQLIVDELASRLLDLRESYASTLDEVTAETYRPAFNRVAVKRFRPYSGLLFDEI
jgi:hypothetical protein